MDSSYHFAQPNDGTLIDQYSAAPILISEGDLVYLGATTFLDPLTGDNKAAWGPALPTQGQQAHGRVLRLLDRQDGYGLMDIQVFGSLHLEEGHGFDAADSVWLSQTTAGGRVALATGVFPPSGPLVAGEVQMLGIAYDSRQILYLDHAPTFTV